MIQWNLTWIYFSSTVQNYTRCKKINSDTINKYCKSTVATFIYLMYCQKKLKLQNFNQRK